MTSQILIYKDCETVRIITDLSMNLKILQKSNFWSPGLLYMSQ